jgi:hypothetical protein
MSIPGPKRMPDYPKPDITVIGTQPPRGGVDSVTIEAAIKRQRDEDTRARLERAVDGALLWLRQSDSNPDTDRLQDVTVIEARGIIVNALRIEGFPI